MGRYEQTRCRDCNEVLGYLIDRNREYGIYSSCLPVAERLRQRSEELAKPFDEIRRQSRDGEADVWIFLEGLLMIGAYGSLDDIHRMRLERKRLTKNLEKVSKQARDLAESIRELSETRDAASHCDDLSLSVASLLVEAGKSNNLFATYLKPKIEMLANQFDLKYWPDLASMLDVLTFQSGAAEVFAIDEVVDAATRSPRSGRSDQLRAVYKMIEEQIDGSHLCPSFHLTDGAMADLVPVLFDLGPDKCIDEAYIRRFHQSEREAGKASSSSSTAS